jgi:hypothetical protein
MRDLGVVVKDVKITPLDGLERNGMSLIARVMSMR